LEGDGSGRFGGGISIPAAKACDEPSRPGERGFVMRVLLERGPALVFDGEALKQGESVGAEGGLCGLLASTVACLQQLEGEHGGLGRDGGELEEPLGDLDLTVFELEALTLQEPPELLDDPAHLVPIDDL